MTTTLAALGRHLGLDPSTISLALRDSPRIAERTRERVRAAADRLGYRPNLAARQLVAGARRPHLLGLVLPDAMASLGSQVVGRTVRRLCELAEGDDVILHLYSARSAVAVGAAAPALAHPDGVFVWGSVPAAAVATVARGRPSVVLDPHDPSYRGYAGAALALDNRGVGALIARHLAARGAKRLLILRERDAHLQHLDRWDGAREGWIAERPLESATVAHLDELDDARLRAFAAKRGGAIFCSADSTALMVWRRLTRLGLRVPDDVRLAGVDGEEYAGALGLTTARFASEALAEAAYATLRALIAGEPPPPATPIPFTLLPGDTA